MHKYTSDFVEIYNYDYKNELIRIDQIESIVKPSDRVHDNGCVKLLSGRTISFGSANGAQKLIDDLVVMSL